MLSFATREREYSSAWYYLTDAEGQPCAGDIAFGDGVIACETPEPMAALNLLYEVAGFGEVMCRTQALPHTEKPYDLEDALREGRRDQIEALAMRCHDAGFEPAPWSPA